MGTIQIGHLEHSTDTFEDWWLCLEGAPGLVFAQGQVEESETGTLHIQVYTEWQTSVRRTEVIKRAGKGHWTSRRESRTQCRDYCKKVESRVLSFDTIGTFRPDVKKDPMASPKKQAIKMLMDGLSPVEICAISPEIFFTHHKSICETWMMLQTVAQTKHLRTEEEE